MKPTLERLPDRGGAINVVVADFQPLAAANALAVDLAEADAGLTVLRIDPVRDLAGTRTYRSLPELATAYAEVLAAEPVDCIVGYCSACVLAGRIAAELGDLPAVLVAPTRPDVSQAVDDFMGFLAKVKAPPRSVPPELYRGGPEAHAVMNHRLAVALDAWAIADEMDDDEIELLSAELLARFDGWLGFLLATAAAGEPLARKHVVPQLDLPATAALIKQLAAGEDA